MHLFTNCLEVWSSRKLGSAMATASSSKEYSSVVPSGLDRPATVVSSSAMALHFLLFGFGQKGDPILLHVTVRAYRKFKEEAIVRVTLLDSIHSKALPLDTPTAERLSEK